MLTEDQICDKYLSGASMLALAKEVGRSQCYIDGVLSRGNVEKRPQGRAGGVPRPERQIPDELKQKIVQLYDAGASSLKIADAVGLSKTTVLRTLSLCGQERRTQKIDISASAKRLYLSGMSSIKIASELGVSKRTVLRYLTADGVSMRSQKDTRASEIISRYQSGSAASEIAEQFKVSTGYVFSLLRRIGSQPRRKIIKGMAIDVAQIKEMYERGQTPSQIGGEVGASRSTILSRLSDAGVKIRKHVHTYSYTSPCAGAISLKGTWEVAYAKVLDARLKSGEIAHWEYEPDRLTVLGDLVYIPDFKVYAHGGTHCYHEIKGKLWLKSLRKILDARQRGHNVLLIRRSLLRPIFRHFGLTVYL